MIIYNIDAWNRKHSKTIKKINAKNVCKDSIVSSIVSLGWVEKKINSTMRKESIMFFVHVNLNDYLQNKLFNY